MKKLTLILFLFISIISYGQYSSYYGRVDVNVKKTVNANINKTITTINYGALRLANAQREKNRLESSKYSDSRQRSQAIEIALNPKKAFDYGTDNNVILNKKSAKSSGFSKGTLFYHRIPNPALFVRTQGWEYINESEDGVVTELALGSPKYLFGTTTFLKKKKKEKEAMYRKWQPYVGKTERFVKSKMEIDKVGKIREGLFLHKIDLNKGKIYGKDGFVLSRFYEDDYEYVIKDIFAYISPKGVIYNASVKYRGDKDEVTFEMLEGRRSYLKKLCAQIIATARMDLGKNRKKWYEY